MQKRVDEFYAKLRDAQSNERLAWDAWVSALTELNRMRESERDRLSLPVAMGAK